MTAPTSPWTESLQRQEVISAEEFRPLLVEAADALLRLGNGALQAPPDQWPKRRIYLIAQRSTQLETWLDDFGARENQAFLVFRELTAMIRWFALAMGGLAHLDSRMSSYVVPDRAWSEETLALRVRGSAIELGSMIQGCFTAFRAAWDQQGLTWPEGRLGDDIAVEPLPRKRLVRDLIELADGDESGGEPSQAIRLPARFLAAADYLRELVTGSGTALDELRGFMARRCTEENARTHEARVHNLQSYYDSFLANSPLEREHPSLRELRGAISQAFHLLEAVTALSHLYERHDVYERHGAARDLFERLVDEERLLGIIVSTCLQGAYECMQQGVPQAQRLVQAFTRQAQIEISIPEEITLHARPISLIASVVNHHATEVTAEIDGQSCNAASIMQLLVLAGTYPSARQICFQGDEGVLADLERLFAHRLGEDGMDGLPPELDYLRS